MDLESLIQLTAAKVVQSAIKGEPGTGYESGDRGPFACHNCQHFAGGYCNQAEMKKLSKLPRNGKGNVKVDPKGCCEYIQRR